MKYKNATRVLHARIAELRDIIAGLEYNPSKKKTKDQIAQELKTLEAEKREMIKAIAALDVESDLAELCKTRGDKMPPEDLSVEYIRETLPQLSSLEAASLLVFANGRGIRHQACFGDGSIMHPLWLKTTKKEGGS